MCPTMDEKLKKVRVMCVYGGGGQNRILFSHERVEDSPLAIRMKLQGIILSEISQTNI